MSRRCVCSTAGILFSLAISAHQAFAQGSEREPKRVLLLYQSFATNLVYAKTIRAELDRQTPDFLEIYDAPLLPASDESVQERYAEYLHTRFRDQRLDLVLAIGADAMSLFRRYRDQVFPSTALLALRDERRIPRSNLTANEGAIGSSTDFTAVLESVEPGPHFQAAFHDEGEWYGNGPFHLPFYDRESRWANLGFAGHQRRLDLSI